MGTVQSSSGSNKGGFYILYVLPFYLEAFMCLVSMIMGSTVLGNMQNLLPINLDYGSIRENCILAFCVLVSSSVK